MPIFLPVPDHNPLGTDNRGWNRIALHGGMILDECALKPKTIAALFDALDTRQAAYGAYGHCANKGDCTSCPILSASESWKWFGDEMFVRVGDDNRPWIMNRPDKGWEERGVPTSWEYLLRLDGVEFQRYRDTFSDGVKLTRQAHTDNRLS